METVGVYTGYHWFLKTLLYESGKSVVGKVSGVAMIMEGWGVFFQTWNEPSVSWWTSSGELCKGWCLFGKFSSVHFSRSVMSASFNPMDCSTPGLPVHYKLLELAQTRIHWVGDAIQPSHPLLSTSPPAFNLSLHQGLFQLLSFSYQVAKVLEFQLQHQSFQWIFRTDFL